MATSELEAIVRRRGDRGIIDLVGDVDTGAEASLQRAFEEAAAGTRGVVLNFSRTDYVNSSGIALIVGLLAQARERSMSIAACGLSDHYRTIFEITRLADFMDIAEDEDSAVGAEQRGNDA
jgi:anti-anti-sigma factor